jgi:REP element-mobilizing transposase RayT/DNA-binding CsgD family transcriptional regulator
MARPLRIEFAGALYHVTSRGNGREDIYLDDEDRELFMVVLGECCELFNWSVHSWCQMTNHYHLLIETPDANLSKGMRYLNGVYTQKFNRKHTRVGHVFQGRYKGILVDKNEYLLELSRYIVLNPVRAGMVESAEDWNWSSYGVVAGMKSCPAWFDREWILGSFGKKEKTAIKHYIQFVANGVQQPSPWTKIKNQIYLGSDEFVDQVQANIVDKNLSEVPKIQRRSVPKTLNEYDKLAKTRNESIVLAYLSGGYTLGKIGEYYSLHYSTVSRIIHDSMQK